MNVQARSDYALIKLPRTEKKARANGLLVRDINNNRGDSKSKHRESKY